VGQRNPDPRVLNAPGTFHIHIEVIVTATDLLIEALDGLPADIRDIVESHFVGGDSTFKIQRQLGGKRRDVEATIETGLAMMRAALQGRGIRAVEDVI